MRRHERARARRRNLPLGRFPAGGAAAWTPASVAGLVLWLDPGQGLYQERSAPTTPASADGHPVGTWLDRSGSGANVSAASDAARPVLKKAVKNGRDVVRLDGSDDGLLSANLGAFNFTAATIFVVRSSTDSSAVSVADGNTLNNEFLVYGNDAYHHTSNGNSVRRPHQTTPAGWFLQTVVFGTTPADLQVYLNGVASNQAAATSGTPTDFTAVSRTARLGFRGSGGVERYGGDFGPVLVYNSKLSDEDRQLVEGQLNEDWDLF